MAAGLVAVVSGLLDALTRFLVPLPEELQAAALVSPISMTVIQLFSIVLISVVMYRAGRVFGGYGDLTGAFKATIWLSLVGLVFSMVTIILMTVSSGLAQMFQLVSILWMLAIFTVFVQALHGFGSLFTTLAGVLGTIFAVATVIVIALSMFGFLPGTT